MGPSKHAEFGLGPQVGVLLEGLKQENDLCKETTFLETCLQCIEPHPDPPFFPRCAIPSLPSWSTHHPFASPPTGLSGWVLAPLSPLLPARP